jgi:hypothetical protein
VFWSKIWFFLVAVIATLGIAVALVLPRPAQRAMAIEETQRLTVACGVVEILLQDDARKRVDLTGAFARDPNIEAELAAASAAPALDDARMRKARTTGDTVMKGIEGARKPDLAILIDKKGRVVARVRVGDADYGDVLAGRPLVDDALAGYLRDDLWVLSGGAMYFVSAAPVVKDAEYVGAVVLGHKVTNDFAVGLVGKSLLVELGIYHGSDTIAATQILAFDQGPMKETLAKLKGDPKGDCKNEINDPIDVGANGKTYSALIARLPGEAGARGAHYAVFGEKPRAKGLMATLDGVAKEDLGFGNFPWILVAGGFVVALGLGIFLMLWESDRPLKRLAADAVRLGKGELERMPEDAHPGKFGSIARSVNIHIDKLGREAKTARKDLDQLLGPAPEGSLGTIDLLATALPSVRPGGPAPAVPPPPSEFRFGEASAPPPPPVAFRAPAPPPPAPPLPSMAASRAPAPPVPSARPGTPPPVRTTGPVPALLDEDILGGTGHSSQFDLPSAGAARATPSPAAAPKGPDPYFKQVFEQFLAVKRSCNEPTAGLTFEKFSDKLIRNRDDLKSKTGCKDVRFTVYVKDGKAALKATPVKDE